MSKTYVITPSYDKTSFNSLSLANIDENLSHLQISRIEIDPECKWTFYVYGDQELDYTSSITCLAEQIPEASSIALVFEKREGADFSPVDDWEYILSRLSSSIPGINGFLSVVNLILNDNVFEIQLPSSVHANWFADKGCKALIEAILLERMGRIVRVEVSTFTMAEDAVVIEFPECQDEYIEEDVPKTKEKYSRNRTKKTLQEGVLRGKLIKADVTSISDLEEGDRGVTVKGYIFNIESKTLKNGSMLHSFAICDKNSSVYCKVLMYAEETPLNLEQNMWVMVRGDYQHDTFAKELILLVKDIQECESAAIREDVAKEKRVELHLHTKMSALDAISSVSDLFQRAAHFGHPACAVTDHGVVQSFPDAYKEAKKHGIKPIFGIEGYLCEAENGADGETYHVCILAKTLSGLIRLYKLVSMSHTDNFKRHPRICRKWLNEDRDGLLIGSACEAGELYQAILNGKSAEELERIASFYDYLEIMPTGNNEFMVRSKVVSSVEDIKGHNKVIYELGTKLGIKVVATGDVHFLDPEDSVYREVLMAGQGYVDFDQQAPLYFKTTDEMLTEFSYLGEKEAHEVVVDNTNDISALIEDLRPIPDELVTPHIDGAEEEVRHMAEDRAKEVYGDPLPEIVKARLHRELNCIIDNGYAVIYLVAHKLVKKSLEDGYVVGSRGSVGSSLVATMCNITEVNPLPPHYVCPICKYSDFSNEEGALSGYDLGDKKCPLCDNEMVKEGHDIPFEVFMGFDGDKNPDIDLNFSGEYQAIIHKYAEEIFGSDNVFRAGTISTIAEKTAFGFARAYAEKKGKDISRAELSRLALGCSGVKRTTGQHPGGIIVVPKEDSIFRFTPVQHPANDVDTDIRTTHFDYKSIHDNLLKLDLLGHDDPTSIKMLEDLTNVKASSIPMDDVATMDIFSSSSSLSIPEEKADEIGTVAIPEFGTRFVRGMLKETKPKTFAELVQISGLSHGTDVWLNNAQDLITSKTATLSQVITVRDEIMTYLMKSNMSPNDSFRIMEQVRKGRGLLEEDEKLMEECNVPKWYAESCNKIKYMFPKAHAVAYVMMAFRIAYYKVHHPQAFYATYFHICREDFDTSFTTLDVDSAKKRYAELSNRNDLTQKEKGNASVLEVVIESLLRGVKLLPVDIEKSDSTKFTIEDDGIRVPFVVISGLGETVAKSIVQARCDREFTSIDDLKDRTKLSKSSIETMKSLGILDNMQETNQLSLFM